MSTAKRAQGARVQGVFRRGDTYHLRYRVEGRQIRVSLFTSDEETAHRAAAKRIAKGADEGAKLWERELDAYLASRAAKDRMSTTTVSLRRAVLVKFGKELGVVSPRTITGATVRDWYKQLRGEVSEETAQTYLRWLRTFLGHLAREGATVQRIEWPELPRIKRRLRQPFCSAAQVAQLIEVAPDDEMRFILFCGFHAGLRRGEIAEARPEWFDLKSGLLHIQRSETWEPKDRDARTIPLTKEFLRFLKKYPLCSPFVLKGTTMKRARRWRYRYDFRRPFEALMKAQGMEWVTPHTMRRTFASLKVSAGVSLYKVAIWLGDLESVVQDHYGFLIPKDADINRGL